MGRLVNASPSPFFKMASGKDQPHRSFHDWALSGPPNPGSDAAIAASCGCPVLDNGYGRGSMWGTPAKPVFIYTVGCPVHREPEDDTRA